MFIETITIIGLICGTNKSCKSNITDCFERPRSYELQVDDKETIYQGGSPIKILTKCVDDYNNGIPSSGGYIGSVSTTSTLPVHYNYLPENYINITGVSTTSSLPASK